MDKIETTKFWETIENAKFESTDFESRVEFMIEQLAQFDEKGILDFEKIFRKVLSASSDYGLMAALYVIDSSVSDDSFLYFRCRLIAEGEKLYYEAIKNPDILAEGDISELHKGEEMLYVADNAFVKKLGKFTDKALPRDTFVDYFDYNFENHITGTNWVDDDLPSLVPNLMKKYT